VNVAIIRIDAENIRPPHDFKRQIFVKKPERTDAHRQQHKTPKKLVRGDEPKPE
jgi:hypothetical protein